MSGLEVAGVVLGVLPVAIQCIKAYSSVSHGLRTFRHYSKEVKAIRVQFRAHHGIFINECRLLLRLVEDEQSANDMVEDANDTRWMSKDLDDKLGGILKENFELCRCLMEASKDIADEMSEELRKFDVLIAGKSQGESIKDTIRRLRNAVRISFDKSKYEKNLASLRDRNADLTLLRTQIIQIQQPKPCSGGSCITRKVLPPGIDAIRTASQKLHEALCGAWCCGDQKHGGHDAKICLDAEVQAEVRLDLAISCQNSSQLQGCVPEPPIWLYVQSISIDSVPCTSIKSAETPHGPKKRALQESSDHGSQFVSESSKDDALLSPSRVIACKKKKQVRFSQLGDDEDTTPQSIHLAEDIRIIISETVAQQSSSHINLCQTKNFCHYLKQNLRICGKALNRHCVGYLESPKMYRHMFYLQEKHAASSSKLKDPGDTSVFSIFDLMDHRLDDTLTMVDQLKLAHKTALAILQFNETPWLAQRWRLKDLSYFGIHTTFNEDALKTLHLSSQISHEAENIVADMEVVEDAMQGVSEEDYFGINNTPLFFLGVALLELAHWKPLESLRNQKDPNEILTARRLAARPTPLGPRYQEIARKCLQCNFGFGTDFTKKELQAAVYGDVVCQLEKMIEIMSI